MTIYQFYESTPPYEDCPEYTPRQDCPGFCKLNNYTCIEEAESSPCDYLIKYLEEKRDGEEIGE